MRKAIGLVVLVAAAASPQSGMKEVVYEVDGTAKYANLTLKNKDGGTEQNQVKLPFELKFYAKTDQFLYLSAQKVRIVKKELASLDGKLVELSDGVSGTVHVLIRVSGAVLQEASSNAPYGIATAEGRIPD